MKRRARIASLAALALIGLIARTGHAAKDPYDRSNVPIEVQPADPAAIKIVLIAGDAGTGHPSGDHEHFAGFALLMRMLQQTPGVAPVLVKDGWPANPQTLKNARTLVFYMDGGGKQTTITHADEIQKMMDAGVGIVHIHQVIDYPTESGKQAMQWLGGVYEPRTGARGHWDESFTTFPEHEITRGVTPFKLNDGWILRLRFVPELKGITPLLRTTQLSPKPKPDEKITGSDNIVCWAYERADGGRAFVLTGGHGHKNWGLPGLRKLVVNGILWSARVEIPKDGAPVELDPADLMTNMERKPAKGAKKPESKTKETADAQKSDEEAIQGIWQVVAAEKDGKPDAHGPVERLEFDGNHAYTIRGELRIDPVTFKLDPTRIPARFDITPEQEKELTFHAIYELRGDRLKLCRSSDGQPAHGPPASFNAENTYVLFLKRQLDIPAATHPATQDRAKDKKSEVERIQGRWMIVAAETDGKPDPQDKGQTLEFEGNYAYFLEGDKRNRQSLFRLDPAHEPAQIDLWPLDQKSGVERGIYELSGDRLKICSHIETMGPATPNPPDNRPKSFSAAQNTSVIILQRQPSPSRSAAP